MSIAIESPVEAIEATEAILLREDGTHRWIIDGQLRESPMTIRNRNHSRITTNLAKLLGYWWDQQPQPRGEILTGEAGVRLSRDPETTVGIDLVYFSAETLQNQPGDTTLAEGVPILAVEILSPSDTHQDVSEKIDLYLNAGVALVWIVDPHHQTVRIHQPVARPTLANVDQELSGEPHLPGFRTPIARIFE